MAIHEGAKEILAGANHYCVAPVEFVNYVGHQRQRNFSVYIYYFLMNNHKKQNLGKVKRCFYSGVVI